MEKLIKLICSKQELTKNDFLKKILNLEEDEVTNFLEEIKKLVHHKDTTVGLYALDSDPCELLHDFWQRSSDACPLECTEAEKQQDNFHDWMLERTWRIEY